jgi:hypothetical protein
MDSYRLTDHNSECSFSQDSYSDGEDDEFSDSSSVSGPGKLRIEFTGDYMAEAVEEEGRITNLVSYNSLFLLFA